ncbi:hypothetical protein Tco_0243338 [Tanacetum coccineum]
MSRQRDRNGDKSDDEDRYRRRRDGDRYRSERGGQDRRISYRIDEEDKDGRRDHYRNMDRDWRTDDRRRDISRDDSRRRDQSRSRSVSSDEEGANEKRRDKNNDKGIDSEDDVRCGIRRLRYRSPCVKLWGQNVFCSTSNFLSVVPVRSAVSIKYELLMKAFT